MADYPLSEQTEADGAVGNRAVTENTMQTDQDRLVDEHLAAVYRYAFRLTGKSAEAEDLTQQTFLIAQQRIDQLRDPSRERAWLLTVLRRSYWKNCRRKKETLAGDMELELEHLPEVSEADPFDKEALQIALDELPAELRLVVVMFYYEHSTYKEIAAALELPMGTVMSRLSRAKSLLRRRLFSETVEVSPDSNNSDNNEYSNRKNVEQGFRPASGTDAKRDGEP